MYEKVLQLCDEWNTKLSGDKNIGVVAGATDLPALQTIRQKSPDIWILCPGVGAQGGEAHVSYCQIINCLQIMMICDGVVVVSWCVK